MLVMFRSLIGTARVNLGCPEQAGIVLQYGNWYREVLLNGL